ncbi:bifunctional 4-hydroxy-2-oxoglutarate aldolase/2-dehydro-3-deoxy-phosphogluconate aldolase [Haloquadratum walsbyi]|jgi:2-dehydro-3-deoxyphosphogluconate aldolase/(4S)-4-hydroxy-2-oxoglutarate aldolase|uniref:2-dehydro-3-deoxy-phosphogluconate aldolase, bacterial-type n=1 Tax=Haloquadratum walsbyi (strain DSM 16854 / JCM 12705 / C23) TaxID=768065 RepID=G0LKA9_HALWC|nr:bifunctional 4-hydroxy-2-oxoglutarate aldolase/2-dehydro-3-deoxy-phosphogluconate aldolase [Haloquadratum walsbyi]CCC39535.1 2-dehydro-3-deoxy-phosphogluconate aldolase, bacterial-type [Haloquadratum walsbyi C23]
MTTNISSVFDQLIDSGVVAVMRGADADTIIDVATALHDGGVTAYEITADNANAAALISEVRASFRDSEAIVGAGTVLDSPTAQEMITSGAEFIVGPTFDPDILEICNRHGTLVAPGILSPTEALNAYEAGADLLKVFPAATVGPTHLSSIAGPLPHLPLMPTGGINIDNVADYIEAGAAVVGAGGALMNTDAIAAGDFESITETAEMFTQEIETARMRNSSSSS